MPKEREIQAEPAVTVSNAKVAAVLVEYADVLEVGGTDSFRVRAYRGAARAIDDLSESVSEMASGGPSALTKLPRIGASMAQKIVEICETGTLAALASARESVPEALTDLLAIDGLGPKKLHVLHSELGVAGIDDLAAAVAAGEVSALPGFGKKSEEKIARGIEHYKKRQGRFRRVDVEPIAHELAKIIGELPQVERVDIAGSFRRGRDTVGDLDLLCIADDAEPVMAAFSSAPYVDEMLASGPTKTSVRLDNGLQVDLRVVEATSFGAAMHYFTGSKEHNVKIRGLARERGLKINEYGVFDGDERVGGASELEVFAAVDCAFVPPELREDRGEFDAAKDDALPTLVEVGDIQGDLQMHTRASDGKNTAEEMARAALAEGRTYIGITDHSKAMAMANGLDDQRALENAAVLRAVDVPGIRVLASIEVDILRDGSLDLELDTLRELDVVVASVHTSMGLPGAEQTARVIKAIESGVVDIVAHPTGRLIQQREPFELDVDAVIDACVRNNVALEINAHPARLDLHDLHARRARERGAKIVISTDAHSATDLGLMRYGVTVARRAWLEKSDVLNTLPVDQFLTELER